MDRLTDEQRIAKLKAVYDDLMREQMEGPIYAHADALDHIGAALRALGWEDGD